ncbi:LOW QUALITY PROTEIN: calmodulin-like protein 4 [Centruroides vittatus]|uniref:calmodulin-like protein 4 n=1 Tax=Centruroides sculpturatus TaxID=218467 RepID=UPI000C6D0C20|nr:calmodulin-like protein 4 [Centruroides sculpturatus]
MARFFREQDIDEFRDCFYLNAHSGQIRSLDELTIIMRSVGMSPTITELKKYFKEKNGKISFADFLEIMHVHSQKENTPHEILMAFRASDKGRTGQVLARDLRRILINWGEKLSPREVDHILREANVTPNGYVKYEDFIRVVSAPVPDYY